MKITPLRIILMIAFVDLVGFGLIIPLQANYAERFGASGLTFGLLIGVYSAMQFLFNPILGRWSDRIGRRPVLLLSVAGSVLSHTLLGVADLSDSLALLFVARILDGITGANIATAQAYIADVTTPENRAKGMGLFGAAFGLGFVLGPALGAGLAALGRGVSGPVYGTSWPAFGAAFIALFAFVLVWRFLPESRKLDTKSEEPTRVFAWRKLADAFALPRLRELLTLTFSACFAFVLLETTFVYLCVRRFALTESGTGLLFAYIGMIMVIVQGGLIGGLVRRFGEARLLAVAPFITACGFLVISGVSLVEGLTLAWVLLIGGCVPMALGHGLTGPSLNALISRQAGSRQGLTLGLSQGVGSLARALGPPLGGLLFDLGPAWPYWVGAAVLVVTGVYAGIVRSAQERALCDASNPGSVERADNGTG